jgi:hypothetical protein
MVTFLEIFLSILWIGSILFVIFYPKILILTLKILERIHGKNT